MCSSAPGTLTATQSGSNVNLLWGAATGAVTGYNVYRGTLMGNESNTPLNSSPITTTSFTDTTADLSAGSGNYYIVRALNGSIIGLASNEAHVWVPLA